MLLHEKEQIQQEFPASGLTTVKKQDCIVRFIGAVIQGNSNIESLVPKDSAEIITSVTSQEFHSLVAPSP
ncbi:hypothetical protein OAL43_01725 [bacterium]|nr:hypothetical protein [bacterium]MDC0278904.1 hypothetical protein [bacterium]